MLSKSHTKKTILLWLILLLSDIVIPMNSYGASWADKGAYSVAWYDKTQTSFDISTPQELAGIAYLVNNNFTDFSGKSINIISDINLSGRDWMPIGLGHYAFKGAIEGNNHTISNINITPGTSDSFEASGFWIHLQNSKVSNLNFKGIINDNSWGIGFVAYKANSTVFENIHVSCNLTFRRSDGYSTTTRFSSAISGMIAYATDCKFSFINVEDIIDFSFGASNGSSCYGNISLTAGGIVAEGSNSTFTKCHSTNHLSIEINGYNNTSYSSPGDSYITFGGILGRLSGNSSNVIGCLAENLFFEGRHPIGGKDITQFRFGGIVGYMSRYERSALKNNVAINDVYNIYGHSKSDGLPFYNTSSYFGGVACEVPENYGGCYSNNDVSKHISKCDTNSTKENGSTSFSKSQMNTQPFVDELNFYSQLEYGEDYWVLESGKLKIKPKNQNGASGVEIAETDSSAIISIYSIDGLKIKKRIEELEPGVYIIKTPNSTKKILVR